MPAAQNGNGNGRSKILLVEDSEQQADLLERAIIQYLGDRVQVFKVGTLKSALQLSRIRGPMALLLLDLALPDSEPDHTIECGAVFGCPWIALSGVGGDELRKSAYDNGAVDFVEKPVVVEVLIDKISRALERYTPATGFAPIQRQMQQQLSTKSAVADAVVETTTRGQWLRSNATIVTLIVALIGQAIGFGVWAWNLSAANALFRKQVQDNTLWIANAEPRLQQSKENDAKSELERQELKRRMDIEEAKIETIRKEVNDGVKDLYQLLLNSSQKTSARQGP